MPRIDRRFLDCTVYLYQSKHAAKKGVHYGGSGFLLAVPYEQDILGVRRSHVYVVTNSHVVREGKFTVIRLNTLEGKTEVLPYTYSRWIDDWDKDDLALCMLDDTILSRFRWLAPLEAALIKEKYIAADGGFIDIGSEVVTIARFISHDGTQQNIPVALFGTVSMLPWEPIRHQYKSRAKQESFLIESKAIGGASGSPVFLMPLGEATPDFSNLLLGIVWGYATLDNPVKRKKTHEPMNNLYISEHTSMMLVIPAWRLAEFLNRSDLVEERKKIEQEAMEEAGNLPHGEERPSNL